MAQHTLREKLRYHFESTMSGGPMSVIRWLAIVSVLSVVVFGGLIVLLGIRRSNEVDAEPLTFVEGVWASLMATLDPGTMGARRELGLSPSALCGDAYGNFSDLYPDRFDRVGHRSKDRGTQTRPLTRHTRQPHADTRLVARRSSPSSKRSSRRIPTRNAHAS